ncbi:MAG: hypothetical protein JWR17_979 [Pseudomonas sp.]|jgi:uncharacterized protein (TIGR02285 family)|uniref:TIGR02285 family protein n=1 Tax=Pseudomonas sp. TaxID=306 RepID=UPI00262830FE|nr:TIGR02285 family protein [Pseudomonas sp.]MDB6048233.1 hypothetical protein [Pseudomonas sp.]
MAYGALLPGRYFSSILLIALSLLCMPQMVMAKDTLIWLLRDFPPLTIFAGPQQGQGSIDRLLPLLIARMPEYNHLMMHVNRARGMQMLKEPSLTCDPTLLWTAERAKTIIYSIPTHATKSNGMVVRKEDLGSFSPFIDRGQIDLQGVLASPSIKLGIVAERSYGPDIDRMLHASPGGNVSKHYGNDAIGSLLQMQRLGRLQALISYWPEARFQAAQQNMDPADLMFYPIKGTAKYQFAHVGCSDTPKGREAIDIINREMRVLRQTKLIDFYADWLDPQSRSEYLQDAKAFFESP